MSFTSTLEQPIYRNRRPVGTVLISPSKLEKTKTEVKPSYEPTTAELWKWTFTREAIAPCLIKDVFNMIESKDKETDFFWLGRVPCRTVRIVGLLVGVQIYEKRIRYTVDDGSAVIDCFHRQAPAPRTPTKKLRTTTPASLPTPKPIGNVGTAVCVVGKVINKFATREIVADSIERCTSPNDEPSHWRAVNILHKSSYSLTDPFIIPPTSTKLSSPTKFNVDGPPTTIEPPTPSDIHSAPASSVASSPVKPAPSQPSPTKLRHPSRLSSRHLTDNTFRIYLKYYMDHAYTIEDYPDPIAYSPPSTPTKSRPYTLSNKTPRAGPSEVVNLTPRPRMLAPLSMNSKVHSRSSTRGFTLSYLRRVPELAYMARRVVEAEAKRRIREQRKKARDASGSQSRPKDPPIQDKDKIASKVKRLFKFAIVQLLNDGSIFLWDGPVRPCPVNTHGCASISWRADSTANSTIHPDSTIFSSNGDAKQADDIDDVALSDPESNEEAYAPITSSYLASHVEKTISTLANLSKMRDKHDRSAYGFTSEDILKYMKKDDRWRFISSWNINEALKVLKDDGRAWCVGKDRWDLTV